jgi:hypothetical protein
MVDCWYVLTPHNRVGIAVQPAFSDDTNAEANARLIAAAPDMFEALTDCAKRLRLCIIAGGTDEEYADIAVEKYHTVLAKARGEQS